MSKELSLSHPNPEAQISPMPHARLENTKINLTSEAQILGRPKM